MTISDPPAAPPTIRCTGLAFECAAKDAEIERLRAELAQFERETADENLCTKHPKTILCYGCRACSKERDAEIERLRKLIEEAPHDDVCKKRFRRDRKCNCWKARAALEEVL
jgi:hypothetical protein